MGEIYSACCGNEDLNNGSLQYEINTESRNDINYQRNHNNQRYSNIMLCMTHQTGEELNSHYLYATDLNSNIKWKCSLYNMNQKNKKIDVTFAGFPVCCAGICYQHHLKLPQNVHKLLRNNNKNDYNVIFRTGGIYGDRIENTFRFWSCDAIIVDINQNETTDAIKGYVWNLPNLPYVKYCHDLVYSNEYGLITIGGLKRFTDDGDATMFLNLNLYQSDLDIEWKWHKFAKMPNVHACGVGVILQSQQKEKGIMVFGGRDNATKGGQYTKDVDFYDFETSKWFELASFNGSGRTDHGKYCDINNGYVYMCCGSSLGDSFLKECEYYNINKNYWYSLPNTNFGHTDPVVWKQDNRLYVVSKLNNGMEWLDLRTNKWNYPKQRTTMFDWFDLNPITMRENQNNTIHHNAYNKLLK
eukprot:400826_1